MTSSIRRWVETDTGHRVPNHDSKCKNMHGHRYRWEVEIEGDIIEDEGVSDQGMLIDFSVVSEILKKYVHDVVDHSFILFEGDTSTIDALKQIEGGTQTIIVPFIPTAENLAKWAFEQVAPHIKTAYGNRLKLVAVHVRETPKSIATWRVD